MDAAIVFLPRGKVSIAQLVQPIALAGLELEPGLGLAGVQRVGPDGGGH